MKDLHQMLLKSYADLFSTVFLTLNIFVELFLSTIVLIKFVVCFISLGFYVLPPTASMGFTSSLFLFLIRMVVGLDGSNRLGIGVTYWRGADKV